MKSLKSFLEKAHENSFALGHFNVSNWEGIKAIQEACQESGKPIIIGVSQGEAEFMGIETMAAVVRSFRDKLNLPIFLNADHFKDLAMVEKAARAGFDSILFDTSTPLSTSAASESSEQNIAATKQAVDLVKSINPEILVEGELGYIGVGSEVRDKIPEGAVISDAQMTTPEQSKEFIQKTGVDLLGPAVGNIHGIVSGYQENINIDRLTAIRCEVPAFLVLHGASGIGEDLLKRAIKAGIRIIHINTELRLTWKQSLEKSLSESGKEIAPYKILRPVVETLKSVIRHKIEVFQG
jgi:fructose-bisphosphate aldolase class II